MQDLTDYIVIDLEVTIRNKIGPNKASPFCPSNSVVLYGYKTSDPRFVTAVTVPALFKDKEVLTNATFVGQNIKFDLLWLLRDTGAIPEYIWDTQLAEYILTGQQVKMASLDGLSAAYGGTLKDDEIKEYWNKGIDTCDIPHDKLCSYLEGDLENTEIIYLQQVRTAAEDGLLPLMLSQMAALRATTIAEHNGMYFDRQRLDVLHNDLDHDQTAIQAQLHSLTGFPAHMNVNSPQQMAMWFFGGEYKYKENVIMRDDNGEIVRYKSGVKKGQARYKKQEQKYIVQPRTQLHKYTTKNSNGYKLDKDILKDIHENESNIYGKVAGLLLELRKATKVQGYIKNIVGTENTNGLIHPDSLVHGQLTHCNTHTGRLSSSSPNLQNLP
jgi:DNA polymerase I-like protein with 3'-5' exonuclease and polymerase domains